MSIEKETLKIIFIGVIVLLCILAIIFLYRKVNTLQSAFQSFIQSPITPTNLSPVGCIGDVCPIVPTSSPINKSLPVKQSPINKLPVKQLLKNGEQLYNSTQPVQAVQAVQAQEYELSTFKTNESKCETIDDDIIAELNELKEE